MMAVINLNKISDLFLDSSFLHTMVIQLWLGWNPILILIICVWYSAKKYISIFDIPLLYVCVVGVGRDGGWEEWLAKTSIYLMVNVGNDKFNGCGFGFTWLQPGNQVEGVALIWDMWLHVLVLIILWTTVQVQGAGRLISSEVSLLFLQMTDHLLTVFSLGLLSVSTSHAVSLCFFKCPLFIKTSVRLN